MRKMTLFAVAAAALILVAAGGWVTSTPNASAAAPTEQIDIVQVTMSAKDLPTQHFHDMTFVFD